MKRDTTMAIDTNDYYIYVYVNGYNTPTHKKVETLLKRFGKTKTGVLETAHYEMRNDQQMVGNTQFIMVVNGMGNAIDVGKLIQKRLNLKIYDKYGSTVNPKGNEDFTSFPDGTVTQIQLDVANHPGQLLPWYHK